MIDAEVKTLLSDGEEVVNMTHSRGWGIVQRKFADKILDLQMIGNVEGSTAEEKLTDMQARMKAADIIYQVLKEVTGIVENHAIAKEAEKTKEDQGFIERA